MTAERGSNHVTARSLTGILGDPWRLLEAVLEGPLHPGGIDATEELLDRASVDDTTRLLDVGCGVGEAIRLARARGAFAVGIDRSPSGSGTLRGDMESLPFTDGSFDVVLGECVLCLSPDLGQPLGEVERVLSSHGRLAISDVVIEGPPLNLPRSIDRMLCLNNARTRDGLLCEIREAGFEINDVAPHRDELLTMRDRVKDAFDYERYFAALGESGREFAEAATEVESAVESGRIGYVSVVTTAR